MKYKHPTLGREAHDSLTQEEGYTGPHFYDVVGLQYNGNTQMTEQELLALGFQPVEEEGDWTDKCIKEIETYTQYEVYCGPKDIREAIEKHMPKQEIDTIQKKRSKDYVIKWIKRPQITTREDNNIYNNIEKFMILFLKKHGLLEE